MGGIGIGGGSNGVGVGAGLSFPISGSNLGQRELQLIRPSRTVTGKCTVYSQISAQAMAQEFEGKVAVTFDVKSDGRATGYSAKGDKAFFAETWKAVARSCWTPGVRKDLVVTFKMNKL